MKKWKCTVCGYVHTGDEPPEKCPVCGADRSKFIELKEDVPVKDEKGEKPISQPERYESDMFVKSSDKAIPKKVEKQKTSFQKFHDSVTGMMVKYHAHPITVHIPNGVLPVAVLFLVLSMIFQSKGLESASFYNMLIVVIVMPKVLFTGYNDWKQRLGGNISNIILTKMICGGAVFLLGIFLVSWRFMIPTVALAESQSQGTYLFFHLIMLGAATVAGFLGGKLVRFPGD